MRKQHGRQRPTNQPTKKKNKKKKLKKQQQPQQKINTTWENACGSDSLLSYWELFECKDQKEYLKIEKCITSEERYFDARTEMRRGKTCNLQQVIS